jgi:ferredoxin-nitrite reductase
MRAGGGGRGPRLHRQRRPDGPEEGAVEVRAGPLGPEKYLEETETHLPGPLLRFPLAECEPRPPIVRDAHIGFHPQRQPGLVYVGVVLPVGRMTCDQMRGLAAIAERHGSGTIRLTVWQNLLISDIPEGRIDAVRGEIEAAGPRLEGDAGPHRAGGLHGELRLPVLLLRHEEPRAGDRRPSSMPGSSWTPRSTST